MLSHTPSQRLALAEFSPSFNLLKNRKVLAYFINRVRLQSRFPLLWFALCVLLEIL